MTLGEGFKELSNMMRGVQVRLEDQDGRMAEVADNTRGQLEVLKGLTGNLELLPETMRELKKALDRTAATDERTSRTLNEFQHHMDKIQGSMDQMVEHSRTQAQATSSLTGRQDEQRSKQTDAIRGLVRELGTTQSQAVGRMEEATGNHLQSLKHAQQDQSARLLKLLTASGKWNRAMLVVLIVVMGGMATLFALRLFV
jgi:chromosome segregation ATPase